MLLVMTINNFSFLFNSRGGHGLEHVAELLPLDLGQKSAEGPNKAEEVEAFNVNFAADFFIFRKHRREEAQGHLKRASH